MKGRPGFRAETKGPGDAEPVEDAPVASGFALMSSAELRQWRDALDAILAETSRADVAPGASLAEHNAFEEGLRRDIKAILDARAREAEAEVSDGLTAQERVPDSSS